VTDWRDPEPEDPIERERERRRLAEERGRALERELLDAQRRAQAAERRLGRVLAAPPIRLALAVRRAIRAGRRRATDQVGSARRAPAALGYRARRRWRLRGNRATPAAEDAFVRRVLAETPGSSRTDGPLVSVVVLNRDGEPMLRRLVPALAQTTYGALELVLVDNASSDGSIAYLEAASPRFPVRIVPNTSNRPYGEANDQGVEAATGELVLLLNNDVEPIHPAWLGHLVDTLLDAGATAVGARLVYPRHRGGRRANEQHPDQTLQHRGVAFALEDGLPVPRVLGAGEDPFGPAALAVTEVPALTAACLLLRRATYRDVDGFSPGYDYGWEDMDFCLRLRAAGGTLVHDGRAVLFHHESTTRVQTDRAAARTRLAANRARFEATWAPRLFREVLLDALGGTNDWTRWPLRAAVIPAPGAPRQVTAAVESGLARLGWSLTPHRGPEPRASSTPDVLVSLDPGLDLRSEPGNPVAVAWIEGDAAPWVVTPWFDRYDVVLADSDAARATVDQQSAKVAGRIPEHGPDEAGDAGQAVRDALRDWAAARRVAIRIGAPSHQAAPQWGDTWFGHVLQRELERAGHPAQVEIVPEWTGGADARADLTVHLFGQSEAPTRPCQLNILWQISHPDLARPELYERYDLVFVASTPFAARMAPRVRVPVLPLHQATDPSRFHPAEGGPAHELLFVGNSRNVRRRILDDLRGTSHDLAVYGAGWTPQLLDPRILAGESIPNRELHRYYAAAAIVLSDHWADMRDEGFIANRLYDALASGGFVISDDVEGIDAEFDGAVVTYRTAAELAELVDRWLADPSGRRERAERGRRAVLERHTFAHRVADILAAVRPLLDGRPARILRV
jgi:GT2 family glycosyltransferase/glycosyltransferase involved in cell wall biosynthesis